MQARASRLAREHKPDPTIRAVIARETFPCDGCGDPEPRRLRELEVHIIANTYVELWLCDRCLEALGLGHASWDPPYFFAHPTGYERIGHELLEPVA